MYAGWTCAVFHVTRDMDTWLVVVNSVINCRAPEICKYSLHKRQKREGMMLGLSQRWLLPLLSSGV